LSPKRSENGRGKEGSTTTERLRKRASNTDRKDRGGRYRPRVPKKVPVAAIGGQLPGTQEKDWKKFEEHSELMKRKAGGTVGKTAVRGPGPAAPPEGRQLKKDGSSPNSAESPWAADK